MQTKQKDVEKGAELSPVHSSSNLESMGDKESSQKLPKDIAQILIPIDDGENQTDPQLRGASLPVENITNDFWAPLDDEKPKLSPFWFWLLVSWGILTVGFPTFSLSYIVYNATSDSQGQALQTVTVVLLTIFVCTAVSSMALMLTTNSPSLSVMLSQRWNPISYLTGYFIAALCYFCCAWVGAIFVMRHLLHYVDPQWKIICAILSFLFIALAQLFPRVQKFTPKALGIGERTVGVGFAVVDEVDRNEVYPVLHPCIASKKGVPVFVLHAGLSITGTSSKKCFV